MGILAVAGLGIGMFLRTERGKQVIEQTKTAFNEGKERLTDAMGQQKAPDVMIQKALSTDDRPDTAMALAFEEAVAA
jgi:hypothetical protein